MIDLYVDADACPVKEEVYDVAGRHGLLVLVVATSFMRVPPGVLYSTICFASVRPHCLHQKRKTG